jgi:biopolymer transport protein ExbD
VAASQNIGESADNPVAINVTAMVDVIFCLCIFFMCSLHFKQLEGKLEMWLPTRSGIFQGEPQKLWRDEITIVLRWDAGAGATVRRLRGGKPAASDAELLGSVLVMAAEYDRDGKTGCPVVIDSGPDVPWQDVVGVMDLCRRSGLERLEFAAPGRPIE